MRYWYSSHEFMEWDGQQRAAQEPRAKINRRFPARYEDSEEGVRGENLEPDPEAQWPINEKEKLDAERKRRKSISNKKYRDKIKQEKKEKRKEEERRNKMKRSQPWICLQKTLNIILWMKKKQMKKKNKNYWNHQIM
jgi:hypothetical protein